MNRSGVEQHAKIQAHHLEQAAYVLAMYLLQRPIEFPMLPSMYLATEGCARGARMRTSTRSGTWRMVSRPVIPTEGWRRLRTMM